MNIGFTSLASNIGVDLEIVILIVVLLGGLIFFAKSFQLGIVLEFVLAGLMFMWSYGAGWNYIPALTFMMIFFVIMCLNFYAIAKTSRAGGVI